MNEILLCGDAAGTPRLSHVNHDREFFTFPLAVRRLSGVCDTLRVIAPSALCAGLTAGTTLSLTGEVRSYNDRGAEHNRLKISAWARELTLCEEPHINDVRLTGSLCKPAVYRRTPFGREIADLMLCVARDYAAGDIRRCDYIPCIAWGSVARMCASLPARSVIGLEGRLQSRTYIKVLDGQPVERTAYEVSIAAAEVLEIPEFRTSCGE